jgi:hypothetical protein
VELDVLTKIQKLETGPEHRVLDLSGCVNQLSPAVREADLVIEKAGGEGCSGNVVVPVDGGGENPTAVFPEIFGKIGAATEKTDPKRSA